MPHEDPSDAYEHALTDLRSYGRRRGRKFSPRQQQLWDEVLPGVRAEPSRVRTDRETWLEIGFGGGEHLIWQAAHNATVDIIGCEPFEDGVVKVLDAIETQPLNNIYLHPDDARDLVRKLQEASISRAFVLFPDPWPKKRHVKRRLVGPSLLRDLARVMKPGAELRIGTDIPDYARTILMAFQGEPAFRWTAQRPADWQIRPDDWPQTRYEQKAVREGRRSAYLLFRRM
jgi:tRNA (guanine-N7-)-methyltransferase